MNSSASLLGAIVLICLGSVFAAIDAAISTVSMARVQELVRDERPGAVRLVKVMADRPRHINQVVLLRIVCEISATVLLAQFFYRAVSRDWGLFIAAVVMVVISFVVIGVGPRTLGRQNAYSIALVSALPLQLISVLLAPISRILVVLGNMLTPGRGFRNGPFASEIELREVVDLAQQRGVVAADERRMIQSVFELGDTPAREVMVPRTEMIWIESDKSAAAATSLAVRSGHSRIPVIGENVDDIVGVVYLKDCVQQTYYSSAGGRDTTVTDVMRPAVFVPDSKPLDELLREMQRDRNHMTLLVDEYGAIAGLVTIEDVLEEIVGEIADEYDAAEVAPVEDLGDNRFRVSARLPIEDVGELYGVEFEEDLDVDTVGGLLALELGRVPLPGSEVVSHGLRLHAEGGPDHRGRVRIGTVLLSRAEAVVRKMAEFHSGFVCFVGRPNTGKSTLTNALVGSKVAITSNRPQTTRHTIRGIVHRDDFQIILVDTPGLHRPRTLLGKRLNDLVRDTYSEVDAIGLCIPADEAIGPGDRWIVEQIRSTAPRTTLIAVVTKIDKVPKDKLAAQLVAVSELVGDSAEIVPVSAATGEQVDVLIGVLAAALPPGPPYYPDGELTDEPEEVLMAEFIREAALEGVRDELPHSLAVVIDEVNPREGRDDLIDVHAVLFVERDSQKGIVIGKGGARLREVGTVARSQIEKLLGTKVYLELRVKVAKNWQRDPKQLGRLGF